MPIHVRACSDLMAAQVLRPDYLHDVSQAHNKSLPSKWPITMRIHSYYVRIQY
jgi:hypothetical protein